MGQVPFGGDASRPSTCYYAEVAQLVEHDLAKVRVAGSNPVFRSKCGCNSEGRVSGLGKEPVTLPGMRVKDKVSMTLLRWFESIHLHMMPG